MSTKSAMPVTAALTDSTPLVATRTVTCPACKGPSLYGPGNPWRPFCSQRCKQMDLGAWASESFALPDTNSANETMQPEQP